MRLINSRNLLLLSLASFAIAAACGTNDGDAAKFSDNDNYEGDSSVGGNTAKIDSGTGGSSGKQLDSGFATIDSSVQDAELDKDSAQQLDSGFATIDSSVQDAEPDKDSACASVEVQAERLPLDLYFMVDRSGSMKGSLWKGNPAPSRPSSPIRKAKVCGSRSVSSL